MGPATIGEHARIAVSVDFAAVIGPALFAVLEKVVGGGDIGKTLCSLGVARIGVRMVLLGEPAIGFLDIGLAGIALQAKLVVWVSHDSPGA